MLDNIKLKRFTAAFGDRLPKKNASNESGGTLDAESLDEGKESKTPKFVQHCVTAITEKPDALARIKRKKDGSPFAICHAQYKKDKRSLAARHSGGKHHTVAQYERALKKLREDTDKLRSERPDRRGVIFSRPTEAPRREQRRFIAFKPE